MLFRSLDHHGPVGCCLQSHEFYDSDASRGFVRGYNMQITRGAARGVGNPVFYVGPATGRDGLAGAAFASLQASSPQARGIQALKQVLTAVNTRTAEHLGVDLRASQQRINLVYPEQ